MSRFLLFALITFLAFPAMAGQVYKWVDEDGNVHYTNTPPPSASQRERQVLDESGRVTETLSAPRTPEEIQAERDRKAEAARQERLAEEQAARDKMLLQTYTSVEEMEMARDGRVAALEAQVRVVSGTISSLETQLARLEQQAGQLRQGDRPVPEKLEKDIEKTRKELLNNQKFLLSRQEEQQNIRNRFNTEIARFKELRGLN